MNVAATAPAPLRRPDAAVGLWVFLGFATVLFTLFLAAYAMRMLEPDWAAIGMPWQLGPSTLVLAASSLLLELARRRPQCENLPLLLAGGAATLAFLLVQAWAWQALLAQRVNPAGNPAASFFYLLTALHALHVLGGLVAWGVALQARLSPAADPQRERLLLSLCAHYWHFLLAVWLVLLATLAGLTPALVAALCGLERGAP